MICDQPKVQAHVHVLFVLIRHLHPHLCQHRPQHPQLGSPSTSRCSCQALGAWATWITPPLLRLSPTSCSHPSVSVSAAVHVQSCQHAVLGQMSDLRGISRSSVIRLMNSWPGEILKAVVEASCCRKHLTLAYSASHLAPEVEDDVVGHMRLAVLSRVAVSVSRYSADLQ